MLNPNDVLLEVNLVALLDIHPFKEQTRHFLEEIVFLTGGSNTLGASLFLNEGAPLKTT